MKVIYFDTETTGLNEKIHDIVQISFLIEIDGDIKQQCDLKCQPFSYENITQEALSIQEVTIEELRERQKPEEMYKEIIEIFSNYIDKYNREDKFYPAGQNVSFDMRFLRAFFEKNKDNYFGSFINRFYIDLAAIVRLLKYANFINPENSKLETIAKYFNIEHDAHNAFSDIIVTRKILKEIISKIDYK
jgi:DNA polymerase-3 subunit epsilon